MHAVLGLLLLASLSAAWAACLRRFAGETDAWLLALASFGLSGILLILGGALLLPWLPPAAALATLGIASAALAVALRRGPALVPRRDGWLLTLAAAPGMALTAYYALFLMSVSYGIDDGFFLHTSNMGMIQAGRYPPTSFLGEPWQGHYGKDMLTTLLGMAFGQSFLDMEWMSTAAIQVLHFLFLVHWLRVEGGRAAFGLVGAYTAFFASAFADHVGLADTIANNNAVAYWAVSLCSYLLLRWWRSGLPGAAVLAGVALGTDALVYELHFGLMGLALFTLTVFTPRRYKGFLLLVGVAVLLACVEGGAITQLARKVVLGRGRHQQDVKKAWQSQNVEVHFPKQNPFYLRRDNLRPSRFFETRLRPAEADFSSTRELAPVWSPVILACFWYSTWLAPLTLVALALQRNFLGAWFFLLGLYSLLTPCLVSFGYFEGETARWLLGTAFGFSTAFGLAVAGGDGRPGLWTNSASGKDLGEGSGLAGPEPVGPAAEFGLARPVHAAGKGRWVARAVLAWFVFFSWPILPMEMGEMADALAHPGQPLRDGSPGIVPGGGLVPSPRRNLAHHYHFDDDDWRIVEKLKELGDAAPGFLTDRYLVNYPDEALPQGVEVGSGGWLNVIGLQTGVSGRLPAGIAGAPDNLWCAPSYSQKLSARAFWADPQLWRLRDLGVRWLIVDETRQDPARIAALPGVSRAFQAGSKSLWVVGGERPAVPADKVERLTMGTPPEGLRARQPYRLPIQSSGPGRVEVRYLTDKGEPANPDDLLGAEIPAGSSELPLVGPYFAGGYRLEWRNSPGQEWQPLGQLRFGAD